MVFNMRYLDERVWVILRELRPLIERQHIDITKWQTKTKLFMRPEEADQDSMPWEAFDSSTDRWYGKDVYYWFRAQFTVPQSMDGKCIFLKIHTQIEEWDDGRNPQFLLFVDGKAVQGQDMNHREVRLTDCAEAGRTYTLDLQAYTGILHNEFALKVTADETDLALLKLYYDLKAPADAYHYKRMPEGRTRSLLIEALNGAINKLDLRNPHSPEFDASVAEAQAYIDEHLYQNPELIGHDEIIASCIGHTHIDVAWWWTVSQTREKTARSFSTVLKLMDEYPDYKFMSSQPQLYVFLKERYPEVYAKIKERVKEGRWIPEGGMWLEADCNLTSGESLVRQFLYGKKFFKDEFDIDSKILWLPDVFGYSGALPQIMKECGIEYFMTTKLAWNQIDKFPHDTFMWKGIDGTGILTHLITTPGVGQDVKQTHFTTYNGMLDADAVIGAWDRYQNKDLNNEVLICYGFGDGGGGPTRQMLECSSRLEKGIAGIPKVVQESPVEYFERLDERVRNHKRLPVWEGELYFEYHRGTLTSMGRNKKGNRKSELAMMDLELLSVLAQEKGVSYPKDELDRMWKIVLLNQFHDILPGSHIHPVYEDAMNDYRSVSERLDAMLALTAGNEYFNSLNFTRSSITFIEDENGAITRHGVKGFWSIPTLAGLSTGTVAALPSKENWLSTEFCDKCDCLVVETPYYRAKLSSDGSFVSLYDKELDREWVKEGCGFNKLHLYTDNPGVYDAWDILPNYKDVQVALNVDKPLALVSSDGSSAEFAVTFTTEKSTWKMILRFFADSRAIEVENVVDWDEKHKLVKVNFGPDVLTRELVCDTSAGFVKRDLTKNTSWQQARFEVCHHKWCDMSESGSGIAIINEGKYGVGLEKDEISLSLLRATIRPDITSDIGHHDFCYTILPHSGDAVEAQVNKTAMEYNVPLCKSNVTVPAALRDTLNNCGLYLQAMKRSEDGQYLILRLSEQDGRRGKIAFPFEVQTMNLIEDIEGSTKVVSYHPFELITVAVKPEDL